MRPMRRLGKFVTKEELDGVRIQQRCSGMFLSGGRPMGDPSFAVRQLTQKYFLPDTVGLDLTNGEFVDSKEEEEQNATDQSLRIS